ncbi:hypothetical protein [Rhodopseudomonas palustris]|uniref:Uncharacterized protein n=1 Tax=Rhodopseudomonas palustris TaxID=1076 RepID=A0A418V410_RHOPL|nr:hypothetical protein [Rhodopseudomonas palustris]RJF70850.1 hypothetical protein D4Q52_14550 [Rhodopseudomonas palustris]
MAQANLQDPNDPTGAEPRNASRFDSDLQIDPELREGRIGTGRIVAFAAAIALLFGAVFYGMNSTAVDPKTAPVATTVPDTPLSPAAQEAQAKQGTPAASDPGPRVNGQAGVTTGSAPSPATTASPPSSQPSGSEIHRDNAPK